MLIDPGTPLAPRRIPSSRIVDFWWTDSSPDQRSGQRGSPEEGWLTAARSLLSPVEQARAEAFFAPADAALFVQAHAMLRMVLASYLNAAPRDLAYSRACRHCGAAHGKPVLTCVADIDFSLSRSKGIAVLAVSGGADVGADVESNASLRYIHDLPHAICATEEMSAIGTGDDMTLLQHWTRKEAVLKATGHGLAISPTAVRLARTGRGQWRVVCARHLVRPDRWRIADVPVGTGRRAAVALNSSLRAISLTRLETS